MKLNQLRDNQGARHRRMRVGRGTGSGKGKTSGRGVKGQKARTGVAIKGFEGGQMPLYMRIGKRGFNNPFRLDTVEVNLHRLQKFIDEGKIDPAQPVTPQSMVASGLIRRLKDGVRLLATGEITSQGLNITVHGASKAAIEKVQAAGGTVTIDETKPYIVRRTNSARVAALLEGGAADAAGEGGGDLPEAGTASASDSAENS